MPTDTILVVAAVLCLFATFALPMIWADYFSHGTAPKKAQKSPLPLKVSPVTIAPQEYIGVKRRRAF